MKDFFFKKSLLFSKSYNFGTDGRYHNMYLYSDIQEKEMEKQKTLYQQSRLHERGAAEMILQMMSASKGNTVKMERLFDFYLCISLHVYISFCLEKKVSQSLNRL